MLEKRIQFPKSAEYGKIVAKDKILSRANAATAIKKLFQSQIERIRCSHEITSEAVNLKNSPSVPKILIIQIISNVEKIDTKILQTIDKAFKVPLIFEIHCNRSIYYTACYRRRNVADSSKWVLSEYFASDIIDSSSEAENMPLALDLETLYEKLIVEICPLNIRKNENICGLVERVEQSQKLEREISKLESRIKKEKQFNRRVELNNLLNEHKHKIETLKK
ncbi:MAG: DUF4391 domain-containing protein [Victivallaceae bacterium]|nr:DUF4391 domain-containing protein [Victivallaceae bacterium]